MKGFVKESVLSNVPVFQKVNETAQGGFRLDVSNLTAGDTLHPGTPVAYDEATRVAKLVKLARVQANAASNALVYQVEKNNNLRVGDHLGRTVGGAAYTITTIDRTPATHDSVTVGTTIGAATAGDVLFVSAAAGPTAAAYPDQARGLLYQEGQAVAGEDVAVLIDGTVYERRVPGGITAAVKSLTPKIFYSQSF